ncbi:MAG: hypothetical protein ACREQQ_04315, partial [Candidatus Binatia bacterium]
MTRAGKLLIVAFALAAVTSDDRPAEAVFLDDARLFKLTATLYTQTRIRMQDSDGPEILEGGGTQPKAQIGQLIQWRNYAYPVFEGDLRRSLGIGWLHDLSFRFAGRFLYDGIYDFGTDQYARELRRS